MEKGYENLEVASVDVNVIEPFAILPTKIVYLLPTSRFKF